MPLHRHKAFLHSFYCSEVTQHFGRGLFIVGIRIKPAHIWQCFLQNILKVFPPCTKAFKLPGCFPWTLLGQDTDVPLSCSFVLDPSVLSLCKRAQETSLGQGMGCQSQPPKSLAEVKGLVGPRHACERMNCVSFFTVQERGRGKSTSGSELFPHSGWQGNSKWKPMVWGA